MKRKKYVTIILLFLVITLSCFGKNYTAKDINRLKVFAGAGDPIAMNQLGIIYMKGTNFFHKNVKTAVKYYESATELNYYASMSNLGAIYLENKDDIPLNLQYGIKLIEKAVKNGYTPAYVNLGYAYLHAKGVSENHELAKKYYIMAAEAGIPAGQFDLAYFYLEANNTKKALKWFERAVDNYYGPAFGYLALYYFHGFVYKKSLPKAYMYAKFGSLLGSEGPQKTLEKFILPKITPEQKAEGERLLKEYIAKHPINND